MIHYAIYIEDIIVIFQCFVKVIVSSFLGCFRALLLFALLCSLVFHTFMPIIYGPHLLMRGWILCSQRLRVHRAWIIIKKVWKRETIILNGILFDEKEKRKIFYLLKLIFNTFEIWYALCFFINWLSLIVSYDYIYI